MSSTTRQQNDSSSTDSKQRPTTWIDDGLDRSPASASPFSRPNENSTTNVRGREYDHSATDGRDLSTRDSPKRGEQSGRPLGSQISANDCDSERWERLRKRDEEILTFDSDRYEREGDEYLNLHRGGGVETDGNNRIRDMTLLTVVSNVAEDMNADSATENYARTLVASLPESETNGRKFEATVTGALVVAKDEHVAGQIRRINADSDDIQQIQSALERAKSPAERFRVLNNLTNVTDDERVQRVLERRLTDVAGEVADTHEFVLKTVVENVEWSA